MKAVKNPFTNPLANNWVVYKDSKNNFYTEVASGKYLAVAEFQQFDDNGNVNYVFVFGKNAKN